METSPDINELAAALSKAQGQFPTIDRSQTAVVQSDKAKYSYTYATLASVLDAVRKPLADNGLSVWQSPGAGEQGRISMTLLLMHTSGQWIKNTYSMPCGLQTPQGIGSVISYARRYQLLACLGLATDDDDDAQAANVQQSTQTRSQQTRQQTAKAETAKAPQAEERDPNAIATAEQIKAIQNICAGPKWDANQTAKDWFQCELSELKTGQAVKMIKDLQASIAEQKAKAAA
jgi:hypothetical protein